MPPIILPGGLVLDLHDPGAQHVQAHAKRLGLDDVQVVRATVVGQRRTYLVLDRLRPLFEHAAPDVVMTHLEEMAQAQVQHAPLAHEGAARWRRTNHDAQ